MFASISKIDEEQQMVYGIATNDAVDCQDEIIDMAATERALPEYKKWGNIREMHGNNVAGTAPILEMTDKGLWVGAKIIDPVAWAKVKGKAYKGFSIGGRASKVIPEYNESLGKEVTRVTDYELMEISLVDRPANPEAMIQMFKRDNSNEVEQMVDEVKKDAEAKVEDVVEAPVAEEVKEVKATEEVKKEAEVEEAKEEVAEEAKEEVAKETEVEKETEKSAAQEEEITIKKSEYDALVAEAKLVKKQDEFLDILSIKLEKAALPNKQLVAKKSDAEIKKEKIKKMSLGELMVSEGGLLYK